MMINNKGFTLIELLAVITIMGILMMVAIPAVSRTIENSRRDTFVDNIKTYINTVRNSAIANELKCGDNISTATSYSSQPDGNYYYLICTVDASYKVTGGYPNSGLTYDCSSSQTSDLMETVAKSSWGGAELYGVIMWTKKENDSEYSAIFVDSAGHGMLYPANENSIKRATIKTSGAIRLNNIYSYHTNITEKDARGKDVLNYNAKSTRCFLG